MTEFVMMGILPDIATDLSITIPQAGYLIAAYALGVVDSLAAGYDLLRGEKTEDRIVVPEADLAAYEAMRYGMPALLQRYGRLGNDLR